MEIRLAIGGIMLKERFRLKSMKSFTTHEAHKAAHIFVSLALCQTPVYTAKPRIWGCSASPVYAPAFAGTHCTHPQRDGQAELTMLRRNTTDKNIMRRTYKIVAVEDSKNENCAIPRC